MGNKLNRHRGDADDVDVVSYRKPKKRLREKEQKLKRKEGLLVLRSQALGGKLPDRSCLMRPLLLLVLTGRKSLNQEMSGSGLPLAAQSMVAVRVRSTTLSWGPISMVGNLGAADPLKHRNTSTVTHTHTHVRWCWNLEEFGVKTHTSSPHHLLAVFYTFYSFV